MLTLLLLCLLLGPSIAVLVLVGSLSWLFERFYTPKGAMRKELQRLSCDVCGAHRFTLVSRRENPQD